MENLKEIIEGLARPERIEKILRALDCRVGTLRVVVENLHHLHNMSAVLRTCEALGVQYVDVVEAIEPFKVNRKISQGSHKWLTVNYYREFEPLAQKLKAEGFSIYAAMLTGSSVPISDVPVEGKIAIVFGNEREGVSKEACELCDGCFKIPMQGLVQSFNVSVAAAISIYDITQRIRTARDDKGALTPEQRSEVLNNWLPKSAPFARRIHNALKKKAAKD